MRNTLDLLVELAVIGDAYHRRNAATSEG